MEKKSETVEKKMSDQSASGNGADAKVDILEVAMKELSDANKEAKEKAKEKIKTLPAEQAKSFKKEQHQEMIDRYHAMVIKVEAMKKEKAERRSKQISGMTGFAGKWFGFWFGLGQTGFCQWWRVLWNKLELRFPTLSQFVMFLLLSNGVTVLQMIMMPVLKVIFNATSLVSINFQIMAIPGAVTIAGAQYFIFDYASGATSIGGGGGLAYFLAVEITIAIAQVINFFAQRNITFKSRSNPWIAAMWYLIAYIAITLFAGALQGLYKAPIYSSFESAMGGFGTTLADLLTMIINCAISFWVFFPIFKFIFPSGSGKKTK